MKKQRAIILLIIVGLWIISLLSGCGRLGKAQSSSTTSASAATATIPAATAPAAAATSSTSDSRTTSTGATPKPAASSSLKTKKTVPALTTIKFTLSLKPEQSYTEYTVPIYLTAEQVLHLEWLPESGTGTMRMAITTPNGKYLGVTTDCKLAELPEGSILCSKLNKVDNLIFKAELWGDGYYIFHPNLQSGDSDVSMKLLYWVEG